MLDSERIRNRFLRAPGVYREPFATDLLEKSIQEAASGYNYASRKVFGVQREGFIHDFMVSSIDNRFRDYAREHTSDSDIPTAEDMAVSHMEAFLRTRMSRAYSLPSLDYLDLSEIAAIFPETAPAAATVTAIYVTGLPNAYRQAKILEIEHNFHRILLGLRSTDPAQAERQQQTDLLYIKIVRRLLEPIALPTWRKNSERVGEAAVDAIVDDWDGDPDHDEL